MKNVTIYHNPKCSNSRGALALLEAKGIKPTVVEYLKSPPTKAELRKLAAALKATAGKDWPGLRDGMLRTKEPAYAELGLKNASDDALLAAVAALPPKQRAAVALRHLLDRPYPEIAEILGCSEEAARANVRAGLATLRERV